MVEDHGVNGNELNGFLQFFSNLYNAQSLRKENMDLRLKLYYQNLETMAAIKGHQEAIKAHQETLVKSMTATIIYIVAMVIAIILLKRQININNQ